MQFLPKMALRNLNLNSSYTLTLQDVFKHSTRQRDSLCSTMLQRHLPSKPAADVAPPAHTSTEIFSVSDGDS